MRPYDASVLSICKIHLYHPSVLFVCILPQYKAFPPGPSCSCGTSAGADLASHPWLVGVALSGVEGSWLCTGSLISPKTVLTAASCVRQLKPALLSVIVSNSITFFFFLYLNFQVGEHNLLTSDGEQEVEVDRVVVHPTYSSVTSDSDIALIILKDQVSLGSRVGLVWHVPHCLGRPDVSSEGEWHGGHARGRHGKEPHQFEIY